MRGRNLTQCSQARIPWKHARLSARSDPSIPFLHVPQFGSGRLPFAHTIARIYADAPLRTIAGGRKLPSIRYIAQSEGVASDVLATYCPAAPRRSGRCFPQARGIHGRDQRGRSRITRNCARHIAGVGVVVCAGWGGEGDWRGMSLYRRQLIEEFPDSASEVAMGGSIKDPTKMTPSPQPKTPRRAMAMGIFNAPRRGLYRSAPIRFPLRYWHRESSKTSGDPYRSPLSCARRPENTQSISQTTKVAP